MRRDTQGTADHLLLLGPADVLATESTPAKQPIDVTHGGHEGEKTWKISLDNRGS